MSVVPKSSHVCYLLCTKLTRTQRLFLSEACLPLILPRFLPPSNSASLQCVRPHGSHARAVQSVSSQWGHFPVAAAAMSSSAQQQQPPAPLRPIDMSNIIQSDAHMFNKGTRKQMTLRVATGTIAVRAAHRRSSTVACLLPFLVVQMQRRLQFPVALAVAATRRAGCMHGARRGAGE